MKKILVILFLLPIVATAQDWRKYYEDHRRFKSVNLDTAYVNLGNSGNKIVGVNSSNMLYATTIDPANVAATSQLAKTLSSQYTDASNVSTTETDLMSYTIPAGQLANDGDRIEIDAYFTTAANANNKTLIFYLGSFSQTWTPSTIASGTTIHVNLKIIRTGASAQKLVWDFATSFTHLPSVTTATQTLSGSIVTKFTGTSDTASSDITQKSMTVTYYPAP